MNWILHPSAECMIIFKTSHLVSTMFFFVGTHLCIVNGSARMILRYAEHTLLMFRTDCSFIWWGLCLTIHGKAVLWMLLCVCSIEKLHFDNKMRAPIALKRIYRKRRLYFRYIVRCRVNSGKAVQKAGIIRNHKAAIELFMCNTEALRQYSINIYIYIGTD